MVPQILHGTEAGARLCNAIRKMLERHENHVCNDRRKSTYEMNTESSILEPAVAPSLHYTSKILTPERNPLPRRAHQKSRSADTSTGLFATSQLESVHESASSFQDRETTHFTNDESDSRPSLRHNSKSSSSERIFKWVRKPPFQRETRSPSRPATALDQPAGANLLTNPLPIALRSNTPLALLSRKWIQLTTDNNNFCLLDVTDVCDARDCKARIAAKVGFTAGSIYITQ